MKELRIIPEVAEDVASAADWYDHEGYAGLGDRFIATFESYASHLQKNGEIYRSVHMEFRRILLRPFPYVLYYRYHGAFLVVVLVVHGARNPNLVRSLLRERQL